MSTKEAKSMDRRSFFKSAGVGAGAIGGAAVLAVTGKDAQAAEPVKSPTAAGYRETDHVKKYYELSKF
jgi:hypothetical protein